MLMEKNQVGRFTNMLGIDMVHSYMVGNMASDILAGQNAGLKVILLESGYGTAK